MELTDLFSTHSKTKGSVISATIITKLTSGGFT